MKLIKSHSLGTVLLEIGLWQSLNTFDVEQDTPRGIQRRFIGLAVKELPGQVGQIYADAVTRCLNTTEHDQDVETHQTLCWKVVSMLDQCIA